MSTQDLSAADEVAAAIGDYIDAALRESDGTTTQPPAEGDEPTTDETPPPAGEGGVSMQEVETAIAEHLQNDPHPSEDEVRAIAESIAATDSVVTAEDVDAAIRRAFANVRWEIQAAPHE